MRLLAKCLIIAGLYLSLAGGVWAAPNPQLTIAAEPWPLVINQQARLTITAVNAGPHTADNVVITDAVPNNMAIEGVYASQGAVSVYNQSITVRVGQLPPQHTVTVLVDVIIVATYPSDTPFNNCAGLTYAGGVARLSCLPNQSAATRPTTPIGTLAPNGQRPIADPNRPPTLLPVSGLALEPASLLLIVSGLTLVALSRRRRA